MPSVSIGLSKFIVAGIGILLIDIIENIDWHYSA